MLTFICLHRVHERTGRVFLEGAPGRLDLTAPGGMVADGRTGRSQNRDKVLEVSRVTCQLYISPFQAAHGFPMSTGFEVGHP